MTFQLGGDVTFRVGDKVAKAAVGRRVPEQLRVARVLRRFIELDDGSRWNHLGLPYPRRGYYSRMTISPWTQDDEDACLAAEALRSARNLVERLQERPPELQGALELVDRINTLLQKLQGVA